MVTTVISMETVAAVTSIETMATKTMATKTMANMAMATIAGREVRAAVFQAWYGCTGAVAWNTVEVEMCFSYLQSQRKKTSNKSQSRSFFLVFCSSSSIFIFFAILTGWWFEPL